MENEASKNKRASDKLPPLGAKPAALDLDNLDEIEDLDDGADLVRIGNKLPRLLHLPDKVHTSSGPEGPRISGVGTGKSLQPGGNNVPRMVWEALKGQPYGDKLDPRIDRAHARGDRRAPGHRTVRQWIALGYIVEEGDVQQPEGPEPPSNLLGYGVAAAIGTAEGEDNPEVLARWLKAENRPDVSAAIKKQIQAVGAAKRN